MGTTLFRVEDGWRVERGDGMGVSGGSEGGSEVHGVCFEEIQWLRKLSGTSWELSGTGCFEANRLWLFLGGYQEMIGRWRCTMMIDHENNPRWHLKSGLGARMDCWYQTSAVGCL